MRDKRELAQGKKTKGKYEIVYRFGMSFEVVEERGYSYREATQRVDELISGKLQKGDWYYKRKIDKSREVGKPYFLRKEAAN